VKLKFLRDGGPGCQNFAAGAVFGKCPVLLGCAHTATVRALLPSRFAVIEDPSQFSEGIGRSQFPLWVSGLGDAGACSGAEAVQDESPPSGMCWIRLARNPYVTCSQPLRAAGHMETGFGRCFRNWLGSSMTAKRLWQQGGRWRSAHSRAGRTFPEHSSGCESFGNPVRIAQDFQLHLPAAQRVTGWRVLRHDNVGRGKTFGFGDPQPVKILIMARKIVQLVTGLNGR